MTLEEVKRALNCRVISGRESSDINISCACASDLMSDILSSPKPGAVLLTGLSNNQAIRTCKISAVAAVIFVRNKTLPVETIRLAEEYEIPVLQTSLSMFDACGILYSMGIRGISFKD